MDVCGCSRPSPGAFLCRKCTSDLQATLILAADIAGDLYDAECRQMARGDHGRPPAKPEPPLPFDPYAAVIRQNLINILAAVSMAIAGRCATTVAGGAIMVSEHLERLRQNPEAWNAKQQIEAAVQRAMAIIDRRPDLRPAGDCEACGQPLRAELTADTATCRCGHVTMGIAQRRADRAAEADLLGTAAEISGALAQIGIRIDPSKIRTWATRGRLIARPGGVYALSDVLALAGR